MKKLVLSLVMVVCAVNMVFAQAAPQRDVEGEEEKARRAEMNNRIDALRNNGKQRYVRDRYKEGRVYENRIRPLYRSNLTDSEKRLVEPAVADQQEYQRFLKIKNTRIVKLLIDKGCDGGREVAIVKPECEKLTMPGAGNSYSFRANRYSIKRLADLSFMGKYFDADGSIKHAILVNIGDVPLKDVNLKTKELETLVTFKPITKFKQAGQMSTLLKNGVKSGNLIFSSIVKVEENKTYALRSIAYKTQVPKRVEDITYDEFDFDERDDVIIAFRVVRLNEGKDVTIVWKQLKKKRSPKMRMPKELQELNLN